MESRKRTRDVYLGIDNDMWQVRRRQDARLAFTPQHSSHNHSLLQGKSNFTQRPSRAGTDQAVTPPRSSGYTTPGRMSLHTTPEPDFRVAIDFGTTYTTIAYAKRGEPEDAIYTIDNFPEDRCQSQSGRQVPSESVYIWRSEQSSSSPQDPESQEDGRYVVLHGYEAQRYLEIPKHGDTIVGHVQRVKLLLDKTDFTEDVRRRVRMDISNLKAHGLIASEEDVIKNLLTYYFRHTKEVLKLGHSYNEGSTVELVFTVPVCWTAHANSVMTECVEAAMLDAKFGTPEGRNVKCLFMVNEAEAGASHALASHMISDSFKRMETFLLVDAGGGTTDCAIYRTAERMPLRLECEINTPTGALVGACDLNERMRNFCLQELCGEVYLEDTASSTTVQSIIDEDIMPRFENEHKRCFKYRDETQVFRYRIRGLLASPSNPRLKAQEFVVDYKDMWNIFEPSLLVVNRLMEEQIYSAHAKRIDVDAVVVIGGFGDSPALRDFLRRKLNELNRDGGHGIEPRFAHSNTGAAAIARGAIIRAQNKTLGPERIPRLSIGIYRHLHWDPNSSERYIKEQKAELVAGVWLIKRTIQWIIKRSNIPIPTVHYVSFESVHAFWAKQKIWRGEEVLFTSESCREDFYQRTHRFNKGHTREMGRVVFDLTHLRELHIRKHIESSHLRGQKIEVTVLIEMVVIDRDLKFYVRWPAQADGDILNESRRSFTIVAAFKPGTE